MRGLVFFLILFMSWGVYADIVVTVEMYSTSSEQLITDPVVLQSLLTDSGIPGTLMQSYAASFPVLPTTTAAVVQTPTQNPSEPSASSSSSSSSMLPVIGGVVGGIVAIAAIGGGMYWWYSKRSAEVPTSRPGRTLDVKISYKSLPQKEV